MTAQLAFNDPATLVNWLRDKVSTALDEALAESERRTAHIGPEVSAAYDVAKRLLGGGKRLRAAFAYLGWAGHSGEQDPGVALRAGVGLEFFQLAALVHDDVIDASHTRRGIPAAHRQFAERHRADEMLHDADDFGQAAAILLGDLLVMLAHHELGLATAAVPPAPASRAHRLITDMMSEVTLGQYLDIYAQSAPWSLRPQLDVDRAHRVVRSKSARYSVEHPMLIGAAMAGADDDQLAATSAIGLPIGEAFQMRDDVLGIFGDPEITGKPSGDDLREGKRTLLITTALANAPRRDADRIRAVLGGPVADDDLREVRRILTDSGAVAQVEELITARAAEAQAAIATSGWPVQVQELARYLARAAIERST